MHPIRRPGLLGGQPTIGEETMDIGCTMLGDGRFSLDLGTSENLNENVVGRG
jgi:hypothetical protein